jgi:hypothetical protein
MLAMYAGGHTCESRLNLSQPWLAQTVLHMGEAGLIPERCSQSSECLTASAMQFEGQTSQSSATHLWRAISTMLIIAASSVSSSVVHGLISCSFN